MAVNQTHPGNQINDPNPNVPKNHSSFDTLAYGFATTERFGDLSPFYVMDHVPDDVTPFRNVCDIRTLSLKSPLMQNLTHHKDFYAVPNEAILPFQWNRIYTNPTNGDDVPSDCNTVIQNPITKLSQLNDSFQYYLSEDDDVSIENRFSTCLYWITIMEMFLSNGSLLNLLGRNFNLRYSNNGVSFDKFYDSFFESVKTQVKTFGAVQITLSGSSTTTVYRVNTSLSTDSGYSSDNEISLRRFLELFRENPSFRVSNIVFNSGYSATTFRTLIANAIDRSAFYNNNDNDPLNYDRCCAYQLVASHFYTNDFVDAVYEAELYRENVKYVIDYFRTGITSASIPTTFTWNGLKLQYDFLSGHFMDSFFDGSNINIDNESAHVLAVYFSLIFSFRKSLRYQDYFTGSKPRPLAVGDVNVNVQSNVVSVIDVTRKIQMQRYLNAVQRVGRKMSNYVKGLFGVDVRPDFHNPLWLASLDDSIGSYEVENTGSDQLSNPQSITSIMRSNSSNYAFEVRCDRPMIVIGISWYDIKRHYAYSSDKATMHEDRFDMFNPMMQFVGDQPVRSNEFSSLGLAGVPENFSYQGRYMEYKQKFSRSTGGFVEYLPGFIFQADNVPSRERSKNIDSDYIRSSCVELDPFMLQVSNYSLAGYWHFICLNENIPSGSRPMAYNPNIL